MDNNNPITTINQPSSLEQFTEMYSSVFEKLQKTKQGEDLLNIIRIDLINLSQLLIVLGDLESKKTDEESSIYWFNYLIPESFKSLFIFGSEIYFQLKKSELFKSENQKTSKSCQDLFVETKGLLESNFEEFSVLLNPDTYTNENEIDVKSNLTHHENPWTIFREQMVNIQSQITTIQQSFESINDQKFVFKAIKDIIEKHGNSVTNSCSKLKETTTVIADILDLKEDPKTLIQKIDQIVEKDKIIDKTHQQFTDDLELEIKKLELTSIPLTLKNGKLEIIEVNLEHSVRKWLDYEVLSNFIDLWALKDNLRNYFRVNLTHLKNNLKVKIDTQDEINYSQLHDSLNKVFEQIKGHQLKEEQLIDTINIEVKNHFNISNYFKTSNPLEIPLRNSIQFKGGDFFKKIRNQVTSFFNPFFKKHHVQHDSDIETATQTIAHRLIKVENEQYDSLFLNKNFIGDLFLIHRPILEEKINRTIELWRQGFNQSALIIGNRLSGKSTFLNYTSRLHFKKEILVIEPESDLTFAGRKIKIEHDLGFVLREIKKQNHQNTESLVLIDDLELWQSEKTSLLENVRDLIVFLESESDHTFVMVSCSPFIADFLNKRLEFSQAFSTIVDVSLANDSEINEAIKLRHGASHKSLYNSKMETISNKNLNKLILKQARINKYNLGEVLQAWTYSTIVKDYNKVMIVDEKLEFPNFFTSNELLVLKQIFLYRYSNEYRLKTNMGHLFDSDLRSTIKRLLNTKVLEREINGDLSINPVVLQDIQHILQDKSIINKL